MEIGANRAEIGAVRAENGPGRRQLWSSGAGVVSAVRDFDREGRGDGGQVGVEALRKIDATRVGERPIG